MTATEIEWTDVVWNPTTGCDRVSPGCDNCYALTMAKRLKGMGQAKYQTDGDPRTSGPGFGIAEHSDTLSAPLSWRKPRKVFVNSMSDLFHDGVSDDFIARVWAVMALTPHVTYQVLTKRHGRLRALLSSASWPDMVDLALRDLMMTGKISDKECAEAPGLQDAPLANVWVGVSAENQTWADIRIPALLATPAAVRWVSAEPLLGPIDLRPYVSEMLPVTDDCADAPDGSEVFGMERVGDHWTRRVGLDWVVSGGESGPDARPAHPRWHRALRDQCGAAGVAFHFKQHGAWAPAPWKGEDGATHAFTGGYYREDGQDVEGFMELGHSPTSLERDDTTPTGAQGMRRVGKKVAGRTLDGCTHDAYPAGA